MKNFKNPAVPPEANIWGYLPCIHHQTLHEKHLMKQVMQFCGHRIVSLHMVKRKEKKGKDQCEIEI